MCFAEGSSVEGHLSWPGTASKLGVKVRNGIAGEPWANAGGKGVSWLVGYFIVNYTIWLAAVKRFFPDSADLTKSPRHSYVVPL
jgi:hypothetical protein